MVKLTYSLVNCIEYYKLFPWGFSSRMGFCMHAFDFENKHEKIFREKITNLGWGAILGQVSSLGMNFFFKKCLSIKYCCGQNIKNS